MTDLERLWDDLPVGGAPVDRILRDARRAEMAAEAAALAASEGSTGPRVTTPGRRRFLLRPLLTAGIATAVAGAFVAGTALDGDSPGRGGDGAGDLPSPAAFQADLEPAGSCDELLDAYVDRGLGRVTAWGWERPPVYYDPGVRGPMPLDEMRDLDRAELTDGFRAAAETPTAADGYFTPQAAPTAPRTSRQTNSDTGTNVQEAGVDEPDNVKTDGELLVRLRDDELLVYDVSGDSVERLSSLDLDGIEDGEILLSGDAVVAVGADDEAPRDRSYLGLRDRRGTRVLTVSVADPARPQVTADVTYDARAVSARQHGPTVRLVLSSGLPDLDFVRPGGGRSEREALARNREVVASSEVEDWLPTITVDGGRAEQLLECTDVAVPDDELALDTVSVVGFEAGTPGTVEAIGLAGATDVAYESVDHLYLAATPQGDVFDCFACFPVRRAGAATGGSSYVFDFELDGTSATHVASGEVEGSIRDRWAMDEAGGVLRLAVSPTSETGSFNSVVTLERDGQDLVEIGRLDDLGPNEDITAVRWFDGLAVLVTFRQVDPLYAVDLTKPRDPTLIGRLRIPGFSSYLHPLGADRMVGVGEGPGPEGGWGAQAGLFDVTDLADVRRIDVQHYGRGSEALAGTDPRSFTWLPSERTVLTVVADREAGSTVGYVSVLRVQGGRLHNRMAAVEYGADVADVRTVPVGDGRVVLVTGEDVRFFPLPREAE